MRLNGLFVLLAMLLLPTTSGAATYYVAPHGNDSTPCAQARTAQAPRKTINAGIRCLASGDTLLLGAGTYPERIAGGIPSGTSSVPTSIQAAPGAAVTLTGGPWTGQWSEAVIGPFQGDYLTFAGFTIDPNYAWPTLINADGNTGWVLEDLELTRAAAIMIGAANFFSTTFRRLHLHHSGLYDKSTVGLPPGNYYPWRSYNHVFYLKGGRDNIIEHCLIHDIPDGYAVQSYDVGTVVRNTIFRNVFAAGIAVNGGTTWYNNIFEQTGHLILKGGNNRFHHNVFFGQFLDTLPHGPDYDDGPMGVYFTEGQVEMRNNLFFAKTGVQRPQGMQGQVSSGNLCDDGTYGGACTVASLSRTMFVAPDSGNFRLRSGAAAIGMGTTLEATFLRDLYEVERRAPWSSGAAQYTGDNGPTPPPPAPTHLRLMQHVQ